MAVQPQTIPQLFNFLSVQKQLLVIHLHFLGGASLGVFWPGPVCFHSFLLSCGTEGHLGSILIPSWESKGY